MVDALEKELLKQRGNGPTYLELFVVIYVMGKSTSFSISISRAVLVLWEVPQLSI